MFTYTITRTMVLLTFFQGVFQAWNSYGIVYGTGIPGDIPHYYIIIMLVSVYLSLIYSRILDGPIIPSYLLFLAVQRYVMVVLSTDYHKYVTGKWMKHTLRIIRLIAIIYLISVMLECNYDMLNSCPFHSVLANQFSCGDTVMSTRLIGQFYAIVAISIIFPILAIAINLYLLLRIRTMRILPHRKMQVQINIILQTMPTLIIIIIRIFIIFKDHLFSSRTNLIVSDLCSSESLTIFFPLGYIFGNVEQWKKLRNLFCRRSKVNDSNVSE
ncbi:unnamed protein product [Caenorhabditis bovis]|uniref:Uncharacterized protein n=1 Tax=Caenorhabditis bovis TaxID=2654633 RepID=A0A8S1EUZ2_9PELO|nr:unnamed protein product [Caenorhabditis bovis]